MDFDNADLAQQAETSGKQTVGTLAKPAADGAKKAINKAGKEAVAKGTKAVGKGIKAVGKATGKLAAKMVHAIIEFIIGCWPVAVALLALILLFAVVYNFKQDERGSSGQVNQDPAVENPTTVTDKGYYQALAFTEPQALMDAYYKYMSCDSHQKVYYDPATD